MAFSRTWNAAYEAQPADTENISLGAGRIRDLKTDIQERLEVDHFHAGDAQDGEHKKLTLGAPIATPANVANKGFLYGKDVGGKIELHWLDEDGNEIALTAAGSINAFPATTSMLFYQSAAPAGWTKDTTTLNKHIIRVVSSTAWTTGSQGSNDFDATLGSSPTAGGVTLTAAQSGLPAHEHTYNKVVTNTGSGAIGDSGFAANQPISAPTTGGSAANAASSHIHTLDVNYIDVIRATKD